MHFGKIAATALASLLYVAPATALTNAEIFNYKGPDREQLLIDGAKKEGQVVLYSGLIVNRCCAR